MKPLQIAGFPVAVTSGDRDWFDRRYAAYERQDEAVPELVMTTTHEAVLPCPAGEPVEQIRAVHIVRLPDGRLCRYARNKQGQVVFVIENTPDYSRVNIRLLAGRQHPQYSLRDYEYMYTGFYFHNRLTVLGGGVLHGSAIAWRGHGVIFSADSGVGKSTHAGLWKQCFGDEVVHLNDDKPAIRFVGETPTVWGTPWSGKTALNANASAPLEGIVFLERGTENTVRRLDEVESMYRLLGQLARPYYDRELGERVVDFATRLLQTVPIYSLTCDISREAVAAVARTLFPGEEICI